MTQNRAVVGTLKSFGATLLISGMLVLPFLVMQVVNRRAMHEEFPFVLFTFMSLHSLFIVLLLAPALGRLSAEKSLRGLGFGHWLGILLGVALLVVYANVIIDQLPCFLGVPNCD
ncbi:MAG: hypothetical protein KBG20_11560 [Caldilineaceae bacterium]|nr:hypothetical protein [Caldilineaceae bacterium]MBP8122754.1 hypothetical protein [Caldilineaceae bacterium]MBP9072934.1 hypothetical protein [Caldilineaceae bacterium]